MQKKALFNPRQTLVLAYLLAVVLWLVRCLAGSAVMLNYKMQGKMPQVTLAPDELTTESFAAYSSNEWWTAPDDDPNWYLSTDSDPHIYWQGQGYIETVELDAAHRLPPGGVALYYLKPGQTDYTEAQKVYAKVTAPGVYTFDLGGQWVVVDFMYTRCTALCTAMGSKFAGVTCVWLAMAWRMRKAAAR